MNSYSHLKTYKIELITKSPVYIGSGTEFHKKEFYYDRTKNVVHIIETQELLSFLIQKGLIDEYEKYMLTYKSNKDLYHFMGTCKINTKEINKLTKYTVKVGDALVANRTLASIQQFVRDYEGNPYIPGSSLKGCLRTAILWKMISKEKRPPENKIKTLEAKYLNTLNLNAKELNECNSILRGISISDSQPIDKDKIILTRKIDLSLNGKPFPLNAIREAIEPGTSVYFTLTIDESIDTCLNVDYLRECIRDYGKYYYDTYISAFKLPYNSVYETFDDSLVLGGGSGYFGKNIIYPLLGKEKAVKKVSAIMDRKFKKHNHKLDYKISPRTLKMTSYKGKLYQYGVCKLLID